MVAACRLCVEVRVKGEARGNGDRELSSTYGHLQPALQDAYRRTSDFVLRTYLPAVIGVSVRALWRAFIQLCSCAM